MKTYLNALGLITPLGCDKDATVRNLFRGSREGLIERSDLIAGRTVRVGAVPWALPEIPEEFTEFACRNNQLMLAALDQIEPEIQRMADRAGPDRVAVVMGTSTAGIAEGELALSWRMRHGAWPPGFRYSQQEMGNLGMFTRAYLRLAGPAYTIATACSSSAKALASAQRLIAAGLCDAAVVGGADSLCRMTLNGFAALEALAQDYCNPFSRNRDGINIGEGAAVFLLSREPSPVAILGVGESSDAYHVCAPDPEGAGAILAMRQALEHARLRPQDIPYVNLHGTATELNDAMEARAVAEVFGSETPCSSTKALTGHMLGAAGAAEAAFLWLMLEPRYGSGLIPPQVWDGEADPGIPRLNLAPINHSIGIADRCAALSNSFAFGGCNASLILGRGF